MKTYTVIYENLDLSEKEVFEVEMGIQKHPNEDNIVLEFNSKEECDRVYYLVGKVDQSEYYFRLGVLSFGNKLHNITFTRKPNV